VPRPYKLKYHENTCRYDRDTYKLLRTFLKTATPRCKFSALSESDANICCYDTRCPVNRQCSDRFAKSKNPAVVRI
jgi:hypothetical protein